MGSGIEVSTPDLNKGEQPTWLSRWPEEILGPQLQIPFPLPSPSLDAVQCCFPTSGPCLFLCREPGPQQHDWRREEGSVSALPSVVHGVPVFSVAMSKCSSLLFVHWQTPRNYEKVFCEQRAHYEVGSRGILIDTRQTQTVLASLVPSFGSDVPKRAGFPRKCE